MTTEKKINCMVDHNGAPCPGFPDKPTENQVAPQCIFPAHICAAAQQEWDKSIEENKSLRSRIGELEEEQKTLREENKKLRDALESVLLRNCGCGGSDREWHHETCLIRIAAKALASDPAKERERKI